MQTLDHIHYTLIHTVNKRVHAMLLVQRQQRESYFKMRIKQSSNNVCTWFTRASTTWTYTQGDTRTRPYKYNAEHHAIAFICFVFFSFGSREIDTHTQTHDRT